MTNPYLVIPPSQQTSPPHIHITAGEIHPGNLSQKSLPATGLTDNVVVGAVVTSLYHIYEESSVIQHTYTNPPIPVCELQEKSHETT